MREALAVRSERDFVVAGSPSRAGARIVLRALQAAAALASRHPGALAAGCLLLGVAGAVATNALVRQPARHPAPLFVPKDAARAKPAAPLPPLRPTAAAIPAPLAPTPAPLPVAKPAPPPAVPARPARDGIGDLIRAADAGPSKSEARVAGAQRALTKLGYGPLKSDGVQGPGTRQAIERFERERRLPVTGELTARTVRELSVQAGVTIE